MPRSPVIDFWFSIGSTCTYLAVMRADETAQRRGVSFIWHPFSVRRIISEVGTSPFRDNKPKAAYMWRDIERRAARYGYPAKVPAPYPVAELDLANRVAVLGEREGWCADYARAAYRRWFQQGFEPGIEPNLSQSLRECGQDLQRVLALTHGAPAASSEKPSRIACAKAGVTLGQLGFVAVVLSGIAGALAGAWILARMTPRRMLLLFAVLVFALSARLVLQGIGMDGLPIALPVNVTNAIAGAARHGLAGATIESGYSSTLGRRDTTAAGQD